MHSFNPALALWSPLCAEVGGAGHGTPPFPSLLSFSILSEKVGPRILLSECRTPPLTYAFKSSRIMGRPNTHFWGGIGTKDRKSEMGDWWPGDQIGDPEEPERKYKSGATKMQGGRSDVWGMVDSRMMLMPPW